MEKNIMLFKIKLTLILGKANEISMKRYDLLILIKIILYDCNLESEL